MDFLKAMGEEVDFRGICRLESEFGENSVPIWVVV